MNRTDYVSLMKHPLGTEALRELLSSVGLPRTPKEEKIVSDLAHDYNMVAVDISEFPELWATLHRLDEQYARTNVLTTDAAKTMSRLFFERCFLTADLADLNSGSTSDANAKHNALYDSTLDTKKSHKHGHQLRVLTLHVAAKRLEAALRECAKQK